MKTKEDIIFEQVGLEGTLKNIGCYDAVLKAMTDFAEQEGSKNCTIHGVGSSFSDKEERELIITGALYEFTSIDGSEGYRIKEVDYDDLKTALLERL